MYLGACPSLDAQMASRTHGSYIPILIERLIVSNPR